MKPDPLLTPKDAAAHLRLAVATLRKWRAKGIGPRYHRLQTGAIRYEQADLDEWVGVAKGRRPGTLTTVRGGKA